MTHADADLLLMAGAAMAIAVVLIAWVKLHPFLALSLVSLGLELSAGISGPAAVKSYLAGFGDVVASVGVILALGAMFGALLLHSRGAERIAMALTEGKAGRAAPWTMALLAMLIGLPVFLETGLVMLMPIIVAVAGRLPARDGVDPVLAVGIPVLAALSVLHGLLPPHPGPLVAVNALHADVGRTLLLGLVVAVPVVMLAGPVFSRWASRHGRASPLIAVLAEDEVRLHDRARTGIPSLPVVIVTVLFPILLMLAKVLADAHLAPAHRPWFDLFGTPAIALLAGTLLALVTLGTALGRSRHELEKNLADSLGPIAGVLFIIGAGGAFKQALLDLGLGPVVSRAAEIGHLPPLLLGWTTAVLIRLSTGSATVATVTASGLVAQVSGADPSLMVLAIGSGSVFFSHVNDAGFWLVKGYFGMSLPDVLRTWSVMETIISVSGIVLILLLSLL